MADGSRSWGWFGSKGFYTRRYDGIIPPGMKQTFGMGFVTITPNSIPIVTPKVRVISLAPWGAASHILASIEGPWSPLKGTIRVDIGPRFLGPCIAITVGDFSHFGVLSPLGDPKAPGHWGI